MENGGRRPGAGRKPGSLNKLSGDVKAMILAALDAAGGAEYLFRQAKQNPVAFMSLLGKLLPTQLTGKDGGAILNVFDPATLSDAELAAQIDRLRRSAIFTELQRRRRAIIGYIVECSIRGSTRNISPRPWRRRSAISSVVSITTKFGL